MAIPSRNGRSAEQTGTVGLRSRLANWWGTGDGQAVRAMAWRVACGGDDEFSIQTCPVGLDRPRGPADPGPDGPGRPRRRRVRLAGSHADGARRPRGGAGDHAAVSARAGRWSWRARATMAATAMSPPGCSRRRAGRCVVAALAPPRAGSDAEARRALGWRGPHGAFTPGRGGAGRPGDRRGVRRRPSSRRRRPVAETLAAARRVVAVDVPSGRRWRDRPGPRLRPARRADRDVLPPEARPPAAARPRPVRRSLSWPISACRPPCWTQLRPRCFANLPELVVAAAPARRRPQIQPRPCHGARRRGDDRRRAAAAEAARRAGAGTCHHRRDRAWRRLSQRPTRPAGERGTARHAARRRSAGRCGCAGPAWARRQRATPCRACCKPAAAWWPTPMRSPPSPARPTRCAAPRC